MNFKIAAYYHFIQIPKELLVVRKHELETKAAELASLRGLALLAEEGYNVTVSGTPEDLDSFVIFTNTLLGITDPDIKYSFADFHPFRRFKVDLRKEIITLAAEGEEALIPENKRFHLSPEEWHKVLSEEDVLLIDTRNDYETKVGKFSGALDPNIKKFTDFPEYLRSSDLPKDKKVLIYCTGGVRCEKAILEMHKQGFESVYQLDGGILRYLERFPEGHFEGECFVFDHRVAVDQRLEPSKRFSLCPHCGDPAEELITCQYCSGERKICERCRQQHQLDSCSKNCLHHLKRRLSAAA